MQRKNETAMNYMRRVVGALGNEPEDLLDRLPSSAAIIEFFELWGVYGTEYWGGIIQCIEEGADPTAARLFIKRHKLGGWWRDCVSSAVAASKSAAR